MQRRNLLKNGPPLLLDLNPSASFGISLRYLKRSFVGNEIVLVRRDANNDEDAFTPNQIINGSTASFCGSGDGLIKAWYEQTGNVRDAVNTTNANQPKIVDSGSTIMKNGLPALSFDNQFLYAGTGAIIDTGLSSFIVNSIDSNQRGTPYAKSKAAGVANRFGFFQSQSISRDSANAGTQVVLSPTLGVNYLFTQIIENNPNMSHSLYNDNIQQGSTTTTSNPINSNAFELIIGAYNDSSGGFSPPVSFHNGTIQEIILYGSSQESNRNEINTNQADYYGITL
jgi:hypothetical protein